MELSESYNKTMIGSVLNKMKNVFRDLDTKEIVKMIIERCRELGVQEKRIKHNCDGITSFDQT